MECRNCKYLRQDVKVFGGMGELVKKYGEFTNPCNRYPHIMRAPKEPACGEFEKK